MSWFETHDGEPVQEIINRSITYADSERRLLIMGPYRLLDPNYLYDDWEGSLPPDPLAPNGEVAPDLIAETLRTVAKQVSEEWSVTAYIASDVDVDTEREAGPDDPAMSVLDQSVAFAEASDGCVFVFTKAGLTTGVGAEAGAIPEHFRLRNPDARTREPDQFCILAEAIDADEDGRTYEPRFESASISELDRTYQLRYKYFRDREELVSQIGSFVESYVIPRTM